MNCPKGRTGHTYSHPPQPTQISGLIFRNCQSIPIRNHRNSLSWTVFGTCPAIGIIGVYNTIFFDKYHMPHLCKMLLFFSQWQYRFIRTDFGTKGTVIITKTVFKVHYRVVIFLRLRILTVMASIHEKDICSHKDDKPYNAG